MVFDETCQSKKGYFSAHFFLSPEINKKYFRIGHHVGLGLTALVFRIFTAKAYFKKNLNMKTSFKLKINLFRPYYDLQIYLMNSKKGTKLGMFITWFLRLRFDIVNEAENEGAVLNVHLAAAVPGVELFVSFS
jgi:hypothetical protein